MKSPAVIYAYKNLASSNAKRNKSGPVDASQANLAHSAASIASNEKVASQSAYVNRNLPPSRLHKIIQAIRTAFIPTGVPS